MLPLTFASPWILAGLLALPALWLLLRVIPPAPRRIVFPAARFLKDLNAEDQTTSHIPWWLLVLRLLTVALVIIALAGPILNPQRGAPVADSIRLIIDNSWSAAHHWPQMMEDALRITDRARRDNTPVSIITTAPDALSAAPAITDPLPAAEARSQLQGLKPLPWHNDRTALTKALADIRPETGTFTYIFTAPIDTRILPLLEDFADKRGDYRTVNTTPQQAPPLYLEALPNAQTAFAIRITAPRGLTQDQAGYVLAVGRNGEILDRQRFEITAGDPDRSHADIAFTLPPTMRNSVHHIRIAGQSHAAAIYILDESHRRRRVGIVGTPQSDSTTPYVSAEFYLKRALEPYAELTFDTLDSLLEEDIAVLILPDVGAMPPATLERLQSWVANGGVLMRFAGPSMTRSTDRDGLLPVPVLQSNRALSGQMSWDEPQTVSSFSEESPLGGLMTSSTAPVTVRQQILADPTAPELTKRSWATLEDGTPFITGAAQGEGWLVFVHTTASPAWSDFALSGHYVEVLRRIIALASRSSASQNTHAAAMLEPTLLLDGFGRLGEPPDTALPIPSSALDNPEEANLPSPQHPPGLYGRGAISMAFNLGDQLNGVALPEEAGPPLDSNAERSLTAPLLVAAMLLFLLDTLIMLVLSGFRLRPRFKPVTLSFIVVALSLPATTVFAQDTSQSYSQALMLAYIQTGDPAIDARSQAGLQNLAETMTARTSAEPKGVVPIDIRRDDLSFFPIIYWPVTATQAAPDEASFAKIQHYLDHGGTIVFDTLGRQSGSARSPALQRLVGSLNIAPLEPMPDDHVLHRTFYLLEDFPGQITGRTIWVERSSSAGRDGVSSIIIGDHNWAAGWAAATPGPGGLANNTRREELALRTGVNMVMYVLTGNYKADQVHVNELLKRMGRER